MALIRSSANYPGINLAAHAGAWLGGQSLRVSDVSLLRRSRRAFGLWLVTEGCAGVELDAWVTPPALGWEWRDWGVVAEEEEGQEHATQVEVRRGH